MRPAAVALCCLLKCLIGLLICHFPAPHKEDTLLVQTQHLPMASARFCSNCTCATHLQLGCTPWTEVKEAVGMSLLSVPSMRVVHSGASAAEKDTAVLVVRKEKSTTLAPVTASQTG